MYTSVDLTSCIKRQAILCMCVCACEPILIFFLLTLFRVKKKNKKKKSVFHLVAVRTIEEEIKGVNITGSTPSPPFVSQGSAICCQRFYKGLLFQITLWACDKPVSLGGCLTVRSWKWLGNLIFFYLSKEKNQQPKRHNQGKRQMSFCWILC